MKVCTEHFPEQTELVVPVGGVGGVGGAGRGRDVVRQLAVQPRLLLLVLHHLVREPRPAATACQVNHAA